MDPIQITSTLQASMARQPAEYVERKGIGHPDTICDLVMESISVALSSAYVERAGRVLHHNIDKGLLVAGQTEPKFGGGQVLAPMRLVVGDRATNPFDGQQIPVEYIVTAAARSWFQDHLRRIEPDRHLVIQNELRPGSAELAGFAVASAARSTSLGSRRSNWRWPTMPR